MSHFGVSSIFKCSKLAAIRCFVFLDFGVWFLLSLWWLYDPHDTNWATVSLGGLTTWHDLHASAPSLLGCCKRHHSISSSHLSRSQLQQPPRKMDMCFPNVFNGIVLNTIFLLGCKKFSRCHCRKEAALNRFISENHKNCDLDHMQVQPHQQRALLGRPLPTGSRCFFLSLAANGHRFELGKRFWNGSGAFRKGNRCRNVLKWKLILLVGFKMF